MQEVKIVYARNPYLKIRQVVDGNQTEQRLYFKHISYCELVEYPDWHQLKIHLASTKIQLNIELEQRKIVSDIFRILEQI